MLQDAVHEEILSTRALSYRRILVGLAAAMIALWWLPQVDLGQLTVFGVKPSPDTAGSRSIVINGLAIVLVYHAAFFAYYSWRDFRAWLDNALEASGRGDRRHFPELGMFLGRPPSDPRNGLEADNGKRCDWRYEEQNSTARWMPVLPPGAKSMPSGGTYDVPLKLVKACRERFWWFAMVDVGFPAAMAALAIFAWVRA